MSGECSILLLSLAKINNWFLYVVLSQTVKQRGGNYSLDSTSGKWEVNCQEITLYSVLGSISEGINSSFSLCVFSDRRPSEGHTIIPISPELWEWKVECQEIVPYSLLASLIKENQHAISVRVLPVNYSIAAESWEFKIMSRDCSVLTACFSN